MGGRRRRHAVPQAVRARRIGLCCLPSGGAARGARRRRRPAVVHRAVPAGRGGEGAAHHRRHRDAPARRPHLRRAAPGRRDRRHDRHPCRRRGALPPPAAAGRRRHRPGRGRAARAAHSRPSARQHHPAGHGPRPCAALTGDALFVGGVGRPDLGGEAERYASTLYDTLFDKLLKLPDWEEVYPAHVGGSACGAGLSGATSSTIGFERRYNYATQPRTREQFIALVTQELPPQPANCRAIIAKNRGELPLVDPSLPPLSVAAVRARLAAGATVLDCRDPQAFGLGHIPGAINVALRAGAFGVRVGWVLTAETPLVLVLEQDADAPDALHALAAIGFGALEGYLAGGMAAWRAAGGPVAVLPQISVHELRERLQADPALLVLDVREEAEYGAQHVREALNIPFWALPQRLDMLLRERPIAVICEGGLRSSLGASLLARAGFRALYNVAGGMAAWRQAQYHTV